MLFQTVVLMVICATINAQQISVASESSVNSSGSVLTESELKAKCAAYISKELSDLLLKVERPNVNETSPEKQVHDLINKKVAWLTEHCNKSVTIGALQYVLTEMTRPTPKVFSIEQLVIQKIKLTPVVNVGTAETTPAPSLSSNSSSSGLRIGRSVRGNPSIITEPTNTSAESDCIKAFNDELKTNEECRYQRHVFELERDALQKEKKKWENDTTILEKRVQDLTKEKAYLKEDLNCLKNQLMEMRLNGTQNSIDLTMGLEDSLEKQLERANKKAVVEKIEADLLINRLQKEIAALKNTKPNNAPSIRSMISTSCDENANREQISKLNQQISFLENERSLFKKESKQELIREVQKRKTVEYELQQLKEDYNRLKDKLSSSASPVGRLYPSPPVDGNNKDANLDQPIQQLEKDKMESQLFECNKEKTRVTEKLYYDTMTFELNLQNEKNIRDQLKQDLDTCNNEFQNTATVANTLQTLLNIETKDKAELQNFIENHKNTLILMNKQLNDLLEKEKQAVKKKNELQTELDQCRLTETTRLREKIDAELNVNRLREEAKVNEMNLEILKKEVNKLQFNITFLSETMKDNDAKANVAKVQIQKECEDSKNLTRINYEVELKKVRDEKVDVELKIDRCQKYLEDMTTRAKSEEQKKLFTENELKKCISKTYQMQNETNVTSTYTADLLKEKEMCESNVTLCNEDVQKLTESISVHQKEIENLNFLFKMMNNVNQYVTFALVALESSRYNFTMRNNSKIPNP